MLRVDARTELAGLALEVELAVAPGSCLALAGPSGAGKTTILRIVAGLLRPQRGVVALGDDTWLDTARGIDEPPERRACGYVFQDYALFPHLRAWENVAYALPRRCRRARANELLERFGLSDRADARPATLSGGERQRVALARAIARSPRLLLLDEPLSALDARTRAAAARTLAETLRAEGVPTLLVTHDFTDAAQLGDEVGVIDGGRVVQRGSPTELAARPVSGFVADFTGAAVLTGRARAGPDGLTLVDLDGGGTVASTEGGRGAVAASVYPWEITLAAKDTVETGSAQNNLAVDVVSVTAVGNRVRVGLASPQHFSAEVTDASARRLGLRPGARVVASWKASCTRITALSP